MTHPKVAAIANVRSDRGIQGRAVRQRAARGLQRSERIADLGSHGVQGGAVRGSIDGAVIVEGPANSTTHPLAVACSSRQSKISSVLTKNAF